MTYLQASRCRAYVLQGAGASALQLFRQLTLGLFRRARFAGRASLGVLLGFPATLLLGPPMIRRQFAFSVIARLTFQLRPGSLLNSKMHLLDPFDCTQVGSLVMPPLHMLFLLVELAGTQTAATAEYQPFCLG